MILINNYKVDIPDNVNAKFAIFTIEFEYDNRLYVGHVLNRTVFSAISTFITDAFKTDSLTRDSSISQAIRNSKFITVSIVEHSIYDKQKLFELKYKKILDNGSFIPLGYNQINQSRSKEPEERKVISELLKAHPNLRSSSLCKPIYRFDTLTGETAQYRSAKEAAEAINGKASNITACCRGTLKKAYGYEWSYLKL